VLINCIPAARATDQALCAGAPDTIVQGSTTVFINKLMAARMGDMTTHGGAITIGSPTVIIGGATGSLVMDANGFPVQIGSMSVIKMPNGDLKVGNALVIKGSEEYQKKVLDDLGRINKTPTGEDLLKSIDGSGKTVAIQEGNSKKKGNSERGDNDNGFFNDDGSPGMGTDSTVNYNPDKEKVSDDPWGTRPPAVGLAHELIHAEQDAKGTTSKGETDNDQKKDPVDTTKNTKTDKYETETVGIPPNDTRDHTENKIRSEWDPPQPERKYY
jgi:type VI secretion system secreted protein VgrG